MEYKYVIGLMSGTSLDGVDLVYTQWNGVGDVTLLKGETFPYSGEWIRELSTVSDYPRGDKQLHDIDVRLGQYYGHLVSEFISKHHINKVDAIASHGHTVHHQPEIGYTLQIGSGKEIFNLTRIKTVYNFRAQDVFLGGQGAPLVPVGDHLLFSAYDYCLNLGGFSNVSYDHNGVRKAFDICPVNTVLNFYARHLGYEYDKGGVLSRQGHVCSPLLSALNHLPFYKQTIPKSLGVEFLNQEVYPLMKSYGLSEVDLMRTFVEHIANQISNTLKKGKVLVTGGGAYHDFLIGRIKELNPDLEIFIPSDELIEYKEALIFALLGKLRLANEVNCLASVTGARKDHSSGEVCGS
ncbi:MAG: anhydro-N-acetylmuramic acid kinase [Wenyingzhuangia sp.]|uniref:anhydro-N-acetylmuramic acid kinase n=1 Tax=Wenyingzhuangia sp. TaxID=1964193 RepID=UPI00321941F2